MRAARAFPPWTLVSERSCRGRSRHLQGRQRGLSRPGFACHSAILCTFPCVMPLGNLKIKGSLQISLLLVFFLKEMFLFLSSEHVT